MRWLVVIAVALAGCGGADDGEVFGGDTSTTVETCSGGQRTRACTCPSGLTRLQQCSADGQPWGNCLCPPGK